MTGSSYAVGVRIDAVAPSIGTSWVEKVTNCCRKGSKPRERMRIEAASKARKLRNPSKLVVTMEGRQTREHTFHAI